MKFQPLLILSLFLPFSLSYGAGMIVESPSLLAGLMQQYAKYVEMLEKAHDQINKLNEINNIMNKANSLMEKDGLKIANPMEVVENLNNTLASIKNNAQRLKQTAKDWDMANNIRSRRLQEKCPEIDFSRITPDSTSIELIGTGKETQNKSDMQKLLEEFTDITAHDINTLSNSIKGMPLAMLMCEQLAKQKRALEMAQYDVKLKNALLNGDYELYKRKQHEKIKQIVAQDLKERKEFENKLFPLKVRIEQMKQTLGVTDINLKEKDGVKYCHEDKGKCTPILLKLDYIINQEANMLEKAKRNSNSDKSQSQADREFIMIDYLREIARHLAFLNETMALSANLLAEEQARLHKQTLMDTDLYNQRISAMQESVNANVNSKPLMERTPKLDRFGFPAF